MDLILGIIGLVLLIMFYMMISDIQKNSKEQVRLLKKLNNEVDEPKTKEERKVDKSYIQ